MLKLKGCPFCGSKNILFIPNGKTNDPKAGKYKCIPGVFDCEDCGLRASWFASHPAVAAEKWNRRETEQDGLYLCDPKKNKSCAKTSCFANGGPCHLTAREEFRR